MSDAERFERELTANLEARRELEQLLELPAWNRFVKVMQQQTDALQQEILFTPCKDIDSTLAQEYKKGQLEGRLSYTELIQAELDSLDISINHLRSKLNAERGNDGAGGPDVNRAP